eukprot:Platyproteum_vivax@DN5574_c0_g1_i1.p1
MCLIRLCCFTIALFLELKATESLNITDVLSIKAFVYPKSWLEESPEEIVKLSNEDEAKKQLMLGRLYQLKLDFQKAHLHYLSAAILANSDVDVLIESAHGLFDIGEVESAESQLKTALSIDGKNAEALELLSVTLFRKDNSLATDIAVQKLVSQIDLSTIDPTVETSILAKELIQKDRTDFWSFEDIKNAEELIADFENIEGNEALNLKEQLRKLVVEIETVKQNAFNEAHRRKFQNIQSVCGWGLNRYSSNSKLQSPSLSPSPSGGVNQLEIETMMPDVFRIKGFLTEQETSELVKLDSMLVFDDDVRAWSLQRAHGNPIVKKVIQRVVTLLSIPNLAPMQDIEIHLLTEDLINSAPAPSQLPFTTLLIFLQKEQSAERQETAETASGRRQESERVLFPCSKKQIMKQSKAAEEHVTCSQEAYEQLHGGEKKTTCKALSKNCVAAAPGDMIFWYNYNADGLVNVNLAHTLCPATTGLYILKLGLVSHTGEPICTDPFAVVLDPPGAAMPLPSTIHTEL